MSITFLIHYKGTTKECSCQKEEPIENALKQFARSEKKELRDFAFYYKGSYIDYTMSVSESVFTDKEIPKFNIFAVLLQSEKTQEKPKETTQKETKEKNEIVIEEKKETKESIPEPEKENYYDIICPDCKTTAIIDVDNNKEYEDKDLALKILNCKNFHFLKNVAYDIYKDYDIDRDPLYCHACSSNVTPPYKITHYCTCGSNLCSECTKTHDVDEGKFHYKIDYKDKDYYCTNNHKKQTFNSYCIDCNLNICDGCKALHPEATHEVIKFEDFKPKESDIEKWKKSIDEQKEVLKTNIKALREECENMINTLESYLKSYIMIEKTLIKRYEAKLMNFQLLRNLSNQKIFENSIFEELKDLSKKGSIDKIVFLRETFKKIMDAKNINKSSDSSAKDPNIMTITYEIKEKNPINRYVKLFDEAFIKNNFDRISIQVNGEQIKQNNLRAYYLNKDSKEKLTVILKEEKKAITDMSYMFNNCKNVSKVVMNWDISEVTSLEAMFQLSHIKDFSKILSNLKPQKLNNIRAMFCKCTNMGEIPNLNNFFQKNNKITNISMLFNGCRNLSNIKGKEWCGDKIEDMSYAFNRCKNITDINLGYISSNSLENMCGLFNGCKKLNKITLNKWEAKEVKDMSIMLQGCEALTKIDFMKYFAPNKVEDISGVFSGCKQLKQISFKNWNTGNVKEMIGMFNDCSNLTSIDFGKLVFGKVDDASGLFYKCQNLKTINCRDCQGFKVNCTLENLFDQCTSLSEKDKTQFKSLIPKK